MWHTSESFNAGEFMKKNQWFLSDRGFSLAEMLIAVGTGGVLLAMVGGAIVSFQLRANSVVLMSESDIAQMEGLRMLRSTQTMRKVLNLSSNPSLEACLKGVGTNCTSHASVAHVNGDVKALGLTPFIGVNRSCNSYEPSCPIERELKYKVICNDDRTCEGVEAVFRVLQHHNGVSAVPTVVKETTFQVSSEAVTTRPKVDFSGCDSIGTYVESIDYDTGIAICPNTIPKVECDGFSIVGLGSGTCGSTGAFSAPDFCNISFNDDALFDPLTGDFLGLKMKYEVSGSSVTRMEYKCVDRVSGNAASDLAYAPSSPPFQGEFMIFAPKPFPLDIQMECSIILRGKSAASVGSCENKITIQAAGPPIGGPGSVSGSGPSVILGGGTSTGAPPPVAKVKGDGAGFSTVTN